MHWRIIPIKINDMHLENTFTFHAIFEFKTGKKKKAFVLF